MYRLADLFVVFLFVYFFVMGEGEEVCFSNLKKVYSGILRTQICLSSTVREVFEDLLVEQDMLRKFYSPNGGI